MAATPRVRGFNADAVRAGLRLAMTVGLPVDAPSQPTFFFPDIETFDDDVPVDGDGVPFDPSYVPVRTQVPPVQVPCSVEFKDGVGKLEAYGVVQPATVTLGLLDEDYAQVAGDPHFLYCLLGGVRYFYSHEMSPLGLVTVGFHQIVCKSEDEG